MISFERFICKTENLVFDSLIHLEPVERFKNRSSVMKFRSFGDSTSSRAKLARTDHIPQLRPLVTYVTCINQSVHRIQSDKLESSVLGARELKRNTGTTNTNTTNTGTIRRRRVHIRSQYSGRICRHAGSW